MKEKFTKVEKNHKNKEQYLNGVKLEKGDTTAIILAAFSTILPFALIIIMIYVVLIKLVFRV